MPVDGLQLRGGELEVPDGVGLSSSCATLLAPMRAEVIRGSRSTHAIAIWASDWPRFLASRSGRGCA